MPATQGVTNGAKLLLLIDSDLETLHIAHDAWLLDRFLGALGHCLRERIQVLELWNRWMTCIDQLHLEHCGILLVGKPSALLICFIGITLPFFEFRWGRNSRTPTRLRSSLIVVFPTVS